MGKVTVIAFALLIPPLFGSAQPASPQAAKPATREGMVEVTDLGAFIREAESALGGTKSVWSEFRQERVLSLFDDPLVTTGVMIFQSPSRVRWETTEPYHSALLADGKEVAQYEWIGSERKRINIGYPRGLRRMMSEISALHQGRLAEKTKEYDLRAWRGESIRIEMVPKDRGLREIVSSIEFEMTPDFSRTLRIVMNEPNGDLTRIIVEGERRDVKLDPATFRLADPPPLESVRPAAPEAKPAPAPEPSE